MKLIATLLQWFFSTIAALLVFTSFADGRSLPGVLFLFAFIALFPPIQLLIEAKIPFLRAKALKFLLFFSFFVVGVATDLPNVRVLNNVSLCQVVQEDYCQNDLSYFVKDTKELYISATPQNVPDGSPVKIELSYTPEPDHTSIVKTANSEVKSSNGYAQFKLTPDTLPIGTYEVRLFSETAEFLEEKKLFTVWQSQDDVDQRHSGTLKSASTTLTKLLLCEEVAGSDCTTDSSQFSEGTETIAAKVDIASAEETVGLKFSWIYVSSPSGQPEEVSTKLETLDPSIGYFTYSLSAEGGFPAGEYELIVALQTANARPIHREFTIQ